MRTLRNAIEQDRVHHAYLFVGSRGTGKTSMAKILAASLNCVRRADRHAVRRVRLVPLDRRRDVARRDRDGRRVEQLGRRHPRPAREGRLRAGLRPPQGLHPRRGAHAVDRGVERVPQDARGAAAAHDLRARHDRGEQGAADGRRPLPPLRLRAPDPAADRRRAAPRGRRRGDRDPGRGDRADRPLGDRLVPRRARARSSSSSPTRARRSRSRTCSRCSAPPTPTCCSARSTRSTAATPARALLAAARLADSGRDVGRFFGDLEAHLRGLMIVQTLGEVPAELAVTAGAGRAPGRAGRAASAPAAGAAAARPRRRALRAMKDGADAAHPARARAGQGRAAGARPVAARADGAAGAARGRPPRAAPPAPVHRPEVAGDAGRRARPRPPARRPRRRARAAAGRAAPRRAEPRPPRVVAAARRGRRRARPSPRSRSSSPTAPSASPRCASASSSTSPGVAELWPAVLADVQRALADAARAMRERAPVRARRRRADAQLGRVRRLLQAQGGGPRLPRADRRPRSAASPAARCGSPTRSPTSDALPRDAAPHPPSRTTSSSTRFMREFDAEELPAEEES